METHTIRWNGTRSHKIITFTPQYLKILKNSHRDAVSLVIMKILQDLRELTGITHKIDYDVQTILQGYFPYKKAIEYGISEQYLKMWFEQGYLRSTLSDCEKDIESLNLFYKTFFDLK